MHILNRLSLRTPESVEIEFTLAGIANRALALCIDYPLWLVLMSGFLFLWSFLSNQIIEVIVKTTGNANTVALWLVGIALLIFFGIYVGYFVVFETLWQGQTPGKRVAGIRVICNDGRPVGLAQTTLRALLRPIDDFPFLGVIGGLLIFFTEREKRLGDFIAGTLVVLDERGTQSVGLTLSEQATSLADDLAFSADLTQLMPDDFAIVRDYLQRRHEMVKDARNTVSMKLTTDIRELIRLETLPESATPDVFLEAVYLAYQKQAT